MSMMAPENIAFTAKNHLVLSHSRKKGAAPAISIYTPSKKKEGWDGACTIIDIVNDDMAFLVDSVIAEIIRHNYQITVFIHPILHTTRSSGGKILNISSKEKKNTDGQSHIHIELSRVISKEQREELKIGLLKVLTDTRYANRDWKAMLKKMEDSHSVIDTANVKVSSTLVAEYQAFIDYLYDNNFTILGYREYEFSHVKKSIKSKIVKGSSLGLLSDEVQPVYINEARKSLTETQQRARSEQEPITISKVNKRSTVHRRVPLDAISIKKYDKKGKVVGEILFYRFVHVCYILT